MALAQGDPLVDGIGGVKLQDVYRDSDGALWEVVALCDQPTVTVQRVGRVGSPTATKQDREHYVIGSPRWMSRFAEGPLRPAEAT